MGDEVCAGGLSVAWCHRRYHVLALTAAAAAALHALTEVCPLSA